MSFKEYLLTRRVTDTPQGDFTQDARQDARLPDARTWPELKAYLRLKTSDGDVLEAARLVWQGYIAHQRTKTPTPA